MDLLPEGIDLNVIPGLELQLDRRTATGDRRQELRYIPQEGSSRVLVGRPSESQRFQADLLDISTRAMRLALHPETVFTAGELCVITWRPPGARELRLEGWVTRLEKYSMINVITLTFP
jgi:hypothetical protein